MGSVFTPRDRHQLRCLPRPDNNISTDKNRPQHNQQSIEHNVQTAQQTSR